MLDNPSHSGPIDLAMWYDNYQSCTRHKLIGPQKIYEKDVVQSQIKITMIIQHSIQQILKYSMGTNRGEFKKIFIVDCLG